MKSFLMAFAISVFASAASAAKSYDCKGKDQKNQNIRITIKEEDPLSAFRDVTLKMNKRPAQAYKHVPAYIDEGIDLGITLSTFMFWIHEPPNMLGGDKIAASYFMSNNYSLESRAILTCTSK